MSERRRTRPMRLPPAETAALMPVASTPAQPEMAVPGPAQREVRTLFATDWHTGGRLEVPADRVASVAANQRFGSVIHLLSGEDLQAREEPGRLAAQLRALRAEP